MAPTEIIAPNLTAARKRSHTASAFSTFALAPELLHIGDGKTYLLETYGCQANEADSERLAGLLEACGYRKAASLETADLVVFNTCAIRANAENKVFGELGRIKPLREKNPGMRIAVGGCMPQEETVVAKILRTYGQVDVVFGTHNLQELPALLARSYAGTRVVDVRSEEGGIVEAIPRLRPVPHRAWVNIMYGCDEFCTYCIVPYTRGKERSRRPEDVLAEIDRLVLEGVREITLLGQNVNSYGLDVPGSWRFADLLEAIRSKPIERVRFTTSHPKDFGDDLIAVLARGGNLMPHVHLPVQSGSDRILKAMNRKYTVATYLDLVSRLRSAVPGISLTTDLIVGFPGEDEEDFGRTLDLVTRAGFEGAYTFIYSPRSGTPAAGYPDATSRADKERRLQTLNERVNEGFLAGNARFVGTLQDVLVDRRSKTGKRWLEGYTPHGKILHFPGADDRIGDIVTVRVTAAQTWSLEGETTDGGR